jgi:hypothetical protein
VPVRVLEALVYDLRIRGVEVTQGIAFDRVLTPADADGSGRVSHYPFMLHTGGKTVVRVYADNALPTPAGGVEGVSARLYGFHAETGAPLQGSPLSPELGRRTLANRIDLATARRDPDGAFTFTLPWNWTEGFQPPGTRSLGFPTELRIELVPPPATATLRECDGCQANNTFTLANVHYAPTAPFRIAPLRLRVRGTTLPSAQAVFRLARQMTPTRIELPGYLGTIDVTDIVQSGDSVTEQQAEAAERVFQWSEDNPSAGQMTIGVAGAFNGVEFTNPGTLFGELIDWPFCLSYLVGNTCAGSPVAVVTFNRPLTSVAHELHHGLGRPHASPCGGGGDNGQVAESWPPDQQGLIQGVGLDVRPRSGGSDGPYRIIAPGLAGQPAQWYDFMSYCASTADNDAWVSTHGWRDLVQMLSRGASHGFITPSAVAPAAGAQPLTALAPLTATTPTLTIHGWLHDSGRVEIASIRPRQGRPATFPASPFHLVVRDEAGQVRSDTPMWVEQGHIDGVGALTFLWHEVPAADAASVEITHNGVSVTQRVRSPNAPQVTILSPAPGEQVDRTGDFIVRWQASDADGDPLMATVDYTVDEGQSFRTLFLGPNANEAAIPSEDLTGSPRARIRVRISDGFNQTAALSEAFSVVAAPPRVVIESPTDGQQIMQHAVLVLNGEASDDALQPVAEDRLCWFAGATPLGCGARQSVTSLEPGQHELRLVAQDSQGTSASASVTVEVLPSPEDTAEEGDSLRLFLPLITR